MSHDRTRPAEPAHDVLAAEEFALPAPDPALHHDEPHDILAAEMFAVGSVDDELRAQHAQQDAHDVLASEAFAIGTADPALHHGPIVLPDDPTGIAEPHDVLAAEEFALPAPPPGSRVPLRPRRHSRVGLLAPAAAVLALTLLARRRRP